MLSLHDDQPEPLVRPPQGLAFDMGTSIRRKRRAGRGAGGGSLNYLFAAQWRTAGTALSDITDGSRFQTGTLGLRVVTAASTGITGFPTDHVLRVSTDEAAGTRVTYGSLPALSIGATRYHRIYMAHTMDDIDSSTVPNDDSAHPIENIHGGGGGGVTVDEEYGVGTFWRTNGFPTTTSLYPNWNPSFFGSVDANSFHYRYATSASGNPQPIITLPNGVVYRFEWAITRTSSTEYTMQVRLYNAAGVQLADENNFYRQGGTVLAGVTFTFEAANSGNGPRAIGCGSNQSNFFTAPASPHSYQAAVAVTDDGWLGAYNTAEAAWGT